MSMNYLHSYQDPDTGEIVDVVEEIDDDHDDDDDDDDEIGEPRNARSRQRASRRTGRRRVDRRRQDPGRRYPSRPSRRQYPSRPAPVVAQPRPITVQRDHFTIRKSALIEFIPAIGQVWASFLGVPDAPRATGNDIADRDNASAHRESLARHTQNQTRILALTELASKAIKVFTD